VCISITNRSFKSIFKYLQKKFDCFVAAEPSAELYDRLDLCVRIYTAYRIAFEMVGLFPLVTSLLYPTTFPQVELFGRITPLGLLDAIRDLVGGG
jgi:hypothetical protein